jgi:hypothetical protein
MHGRMLLFFAILLGAVAVAIRARAMRDTCEKTITKFMAAIKDVGHDQHRSCCLDKRSAAAKSQRF